MDEGTDVPWKEEFYFSGFTLSFCGAIVIMRLIRFILYVFLSHFIVVFMQPSKTLC